jgi:hypothetical protein
MNKNLILQVMPYSMGSNTALSKFYVANCALEYSSMGSNTALSASKFILKFLPQNVETRLSEKK